MSRCIPLPDLRGPALALAALGLAACPALPPRGTVPLEHAAGLPRVVLLAEPDAADVQVSVTLAVGAARDPIGQEGLAGLAAVAALSDAPGELRVTHAGTTLTTTCPSGEALTPCLADVAAAVTRSGLSEADVDRARAVQRAELDALRDGADAAALAREVARAWRFEAHAVGHPVAGRDDVVARAPADVVASFWSRHATRSSTVVGLAGPVGASDVAAFAEAFRALDPVVVPRLATMSPLAVTDRRALVVTRSSVPGAALAVVWLASAVGLDPAADVALQVLADRVGGQLDRRDGAVVVTVPLGTLDEAPAQVRSVVAWLDELGSAPLAPERLEAARARVVGAVSERASTSAGRLAAACAEVATGAPDVGRLGTEAYGALTAADVEAALRTRFPTSGLRVVVVGPSAVAAALAADAGWADVSVRGAETLFR